MVVLAQGLHFAGEEGIGAALFREGMELGHDYIGTDILLGLIGEGRGVGAEVLQRLGADLNRVRLTVI